MSRANLFSANTSAALFGLGAYAAFSTHDVLVKYLGAIYSPFQVVFFTAMFGFPIISVLLIGDSRPGTLRPVHPWWVAVRSFGATASALCTFYALGKLPLSQVYAVLFAAPLIITILAIPILGEKVRLRRGLAVLVGLIGVLIVLRPGSGELGIGHIAALGAASAGALNSIVVRKIGGEERRVVMVLYPMMANFILMGIALPFVYIPLPIAHLGLIAVVSMLVVLAMFLLIAAYTRGEAMLVAPMQYSQIVWAALFGALLFGEYPDWQTYAGMAVIVLSSIYILKRETTANVSRNAPVLNTRTRVGHATGLRVGNILRQKDKDE